MPALPDKNQLTLAENFWVKVIPNVSNVLQKLNLLHLLTYH